MPPHCAKALRRSLSPEEWDKLHAEIQGDRTASVEDVCRQKGVTKQRYYQLYPARPKVDTVVIVVHADGRRSIP